MLLVDIIQVEECGELSMLCERTRGNAELSDEIGLK